MAIVSWLFCHNRTNPLSPASESVYQGRCVAPRRTAPHRIAPHELRIGRNTDFGHRYRKCDPLDSHVTAAHIPIATSNRFHQDTQCDDRSPAYIAFNMRRASQRKRRQCEPCKEKLCSAILLNLSKTHRCSEYFTRWHHSIEAVGAIRARARARARAGLCMDYLGRYYPITQSRNPPIYENTMTGTRWKFEGIQI